MKLTVAFLFCTVGALIFAIPDMTRREILFGLPIPSGFRKGGIARKRIAQYRILVALALAAVLASLLFAPVSYVDLVLVAGPLLILITGIAVFLLEHHRLARFAVAPVAQRAADLTTAPERLPWFSWLSPIPFLILLGAALLLQSNWQHVPLTFPVHWGVNGQPNRWSERTFRHVYGLIFFGMELCAWILLIGLATWFGARRSQFRRVTFGATIAFEFMLSLLMAAISLNPLWHLPIWLVALTPLVFLIPIVFAMSGALGKEAGTLEPTPNECWKAGMIYYNPADPALFVEKRLGVGYTPNFGNRWSWLIVACLVLLMASLPLVF